MSHFNCPSHVGGRLITRAILLGSLTALTCTPANAEEKRELELLTRAASAMLAVGTHCIETHRIDAALVKWMFSSYVEVGEQTFGKAGFDQAMHREMIRQMSEVKITGVWSWCDGKRARYTEAGIKIFRE